MEPRSYRAPNAMPFVPFHVPKTEQSITQVAVSLLNLSHSWSCTASSHSLFWGFFKPLPSLCRSRREVASLGSEKGFVALEEIKLSTMLECSSQHLQLKHLLVVSTIRRVIILAGQVVHFPFTTAISFWKSQVFGCGPLSYYLFLSFCMAGILVILFPFLVQFWQFCKHSVEMGERGKEQAEGEVTTGHIPRKLTNLVSISVICASIFSPTLLKPIHNVSGTLVSHS